VSEVSGMQGLALALAYLIGAIPVGLVIGLARGVDVRQVGSGNIGATNVMRGLGPGLGLLVFVIDVLKGVAGVMIGRAMGLDGWLLGMVAMFAVLGHSYSPYLVFKGGKGVASSARARCRWRSTSCTTRRARRWCRSWRWWSSW